MEVLHLIATQFLQPMGTGRTRPLLFGAEDAEGQAFEVMENHVFYPALRGGRVDLGPFEAKLGALSDEAIDALVKPVPAEWRAGHDLCERTADYLREAREEKRTFLNFVKHLLR